MKNIFYLNVKITMNKCTLVLCTRVYTYSLPPHDPVKERIGLSKLMLRIRTHFLHPRIQVQIRSILACSWRLGRGCGSGLAETGTFFSQCFRSGQIFSGLVNFSKLSNYWKVSNDKPDGIVHCQGSTHCTQQILNNAYIL